MSDDQKEQVCFYPNYSTKKRLNKAIQNKELPNLKNAQAGWTMYDVLRIFASAGTFTITLKNPTSFFLCVKMKFILFCSWEYRFKE